MLSGAGLLCVLAAAIAAGLKGFGRALPVLTSYPRQALLGGFGILMLAVSLLQAVDEQPRPAIVPPHPTTAPEGPDAPPRSDVAPVPTPVESSGGEAHPSAAGAAEAEPASASDHPPQIAAGFPTSEDFYPAESRRSRTEGAVDVRACVDPDGRLAERPTVERSSGSEQLDQAALALAEAGSGHYTPAFQEGRAVAGCFRFRVKFQMDRPSDEALRSRDRARERERP